MSNSAKGAHYKRRSKEWLQKQGHCVFDMELQRVVYTPMGMIPTKRDQLGADIGYLDVAQDRVVFVQVKGGAAPLSSLVASATKAFAEHRFPKRAVRLVLHVWRRLARAPEVLEITPQYQEAIRSRRGVRATSRSGDV